MFCKCGCGLEASKGKYFKKGHKTSMAPKTCACGCGKVVKAGSTFIQGHNGFNLTDKQELKRRARISIVMKGKPCSEYRKQKLVKYFENPENRAKIRAKILDLYKTSPERFDRYHKANEMRKQGILPSGSKGKKWKNEESKKSVGAASKARWQNTEYKEKTLRKILKSGGQHPNKKEIIFDEALQKTFPNQWKYVGDGEIFISGKNPDFININGKKQIIELFGDYWHKGENPQDRIDLFKKYGYDTLVIWEKELKNLEQTIVKVEKFANGGHNDTVEI